MLRSLITAWSALALSVPFASAAERLVGVQSARVMSQSMPWIAQETGIFRKHNLEFPLVYIGTSPLATAAMLGGEAQILTTAASAWCVRGSAAIPISCSSPASRIT